MSCIIAEAMDLRASGKGGKAPSISISLRRIKRNKRKAVYLAVTIAGGITVTAITAVLTFGAGAIIVGGTLASPFISEAVNWLLGKYHQKAFDQFIAQYRKGTFSGENLSAVQTYIQRLQLTSVTDTLADLVHCKKKLRELRTTPIQHCAAAENVADQLVAIDSVWATKLAALMGQVSGFGYFIDWCYDELVTIQKDLNRGKVLELYTFIQQQVREGKHGKACDLHYFGRSGSSFKGLCYEMNGDKPRKAGFTQFMTKGEFSKHRNDGVYRLFSDVCNVAEENTIYRDCTQQVQALRARLEGAAATPEELTGEKKKVYWQSEEFFSLESLFFMVDVSSAMEQFLAKAKDPSVREQLPSLGAEPGAPPIDPEGMKRILKRIKSMLEQDKSLSKEQKASAWKELKGLEKYSAQGDFGQLAKVLMDVFTFNLRTGCASLGAKEITYGIKSWQGAQINPGDAVGIPNIVNMLVNVGVQATGEMLNVYFDAKRLERPIANTNELEGLDDQQERVDALRSIAKNAGVFKGFVKELDSFRKTYEEFKVAYARDEHNIRTRPELLTCGHAYGYARDLARLTFSWDKLMSLFRVILELHQQVVVTLTFTKEIERAQDAIAQNIYDSLKKSHPDHARCGSKVCHVHKELIDSPWDGAPTASAESDSQAVLGSGQAVLARTRARMT